MATNVSLPGVRTVQVVAPAAVNSGDLVVVSQLFGIAEANAASAANVAIVVGGTATLRKLNGASTSQAAGTNVHWDATNANCTISSTSNLKIGVASAVTANADTTIVVHLNPSF
jgi:predicted RecA/RadA family phage recombinase